MPPKIKPKVAKIEGKCSLCERPARTQFDCLTCEKLGKEHIVRSCKSCGEKATFKARQHALIAHPVNLFRAAFAALKGE